ncbi:hypothetical protein ACWGI0_29000 [Streptomyces sp. NPDC054802]
MSGTRGRLVTGAGGMLAQGVPARLATARIPALAVTRAPADITDPAAVREILAGTAADAAGTREDDAPRHPAEARREPAAVLLHVSTDHGFPGEAERLPRRRGEAVRAGRPHGPVRSGIEPIRDWSEALSCARPVLVAESQEGNP